MHKPDDFSRPCDKDPEAIRMWNMFRDLSIERYKKSYTCLNIHFDEYAGESLVREESMKIAQERFESRGLLEES
jgi:arginyl-tRNA synthetase